MSDPANPSQGKPDDEKVEQDAKDTKESKATAKASESEDKKPAAKKPAAKKPAAKKAADKAAATTDVDKDAADDKPAAKPKAAKKPAAKAADADDAADAKPAAKPKAAKKADAKKPAKEKTKSEPKKAPAPSRRRRGAKEGDERVVVRAQARYVRSSARKARLVCDSIRGKDVGQARAILAFHPRAVSEAWLKLLDSAVANAENNHDLDGEDLRIAAVYADEGPTIKRFRPRAMGRATRIRKRTSHLTIQLTPKES